MLALLLGVLAATGACSSVPPEVVGLSDELGTMHHRKTQDDAQIAAFVEKALGVASRIEPSDARFWALTEAFEACGLAPTYERARSLRARVWREMLPLVLADLDRQTDVLITLGWPHRSRTAELHLESAEFREFRKAIAAGTTSEAVRGACLISAIEHSIAEEWDGDPLPDEDRALALALVSTVEDRTSYLDGYWGHDIYERIDRWRAALTRNRVGAVAMDIVGEDLDGVRFRLSDYRGKVVMLDFWGFW